MNSLSAYQRHARQVWQDRCRVCDINGRLVALPYSEATKCADYELGATIAAISANRFIRSIIAQK